MNRTNKVMIASLGLVAGCATFQPPPPGPDPRWVEPAAFPAGSPRVALVLSGGSARGFAHVGVIKALEAHGLKPDLVVGSSAGSLIGALYASGLSAAELESAIGRMDESAFQDLAFPGFGLVPGSLGVLRGDGLHRFVDREARHHRIEDFPIRFAAVATNLNSGDPAIFNAGDVGRAVSASSAVPGLITPAPIDGRLYGDGQLSSPVPVEAARKLGARVVIAVDVVYPPEDAKLTSSMRVVFQAFAISAYRIKQYEIAQADALVAPELGRTSGQWGLGERDRLVAAGERAALGAIGRLVPLFREGRVAR
jgi:NTE family protein